MDLIHKFLNLVLPPVALIVLLLFLPPFLLHKLFKLSIKAFASTQNLAGKVVLITGASSGIGEHLAYEYARRGACLALAARRTERLKAVATKAAGLGSPDFVVIRADVSIVEDCKRLVDETIDHFGQLDYLVNNAGVVQVCLFEDYTQLSTIRSIMDINFWGSVYCTQFAVPHLRKYKGKIVVMSSSGAWYCPPRLSVYNASKAAQKSFFETLTSEYGSDIGITIVTPGLVESEMTGDQFWSNFGTRGIPVESTEGCAKAIVDSACRGDMYLTEPAWNKVGFWFKIIWPQLLYKCMHLILVHKPWAASNKDD